MQTAMSDLKSQLTTMQDSLTSTESQVVQLTADKNGLQQQVTDKQAALDQLLFDKQSGETNAETAIAAQKSQIEQLSSDKNLSTEALSTKALEMVRPAVL